MKGHLKLTTLTTLCAFIGTMGTATAMLKSQSGSDQKEQSGTGGRSTKAFKPLPKPKKTTSESVPETPPLKYDPVRKEFYYGDRLPYEGELAEPQHQIAPQVEINGGGVKITLTTGAS